MSRINLSSVLLVLAIAFVLVSCGGQPSPTEPALLAQGGWSAVTDAGGQPSKIDVCHRADGARWVLINVSEKSWPAHQAHGDGRPGEAVPGMHAHVFDEACQPVECTFGEPTAVPNEFGVEGGSGIVSYAMSFDACPCDGSASVDWIEIGGDDVVGGSCNLDFAVASWSGAPSDNDVASRAGTISTPAGDVGISQVDPNDILSDIDDPDDEDGEVCPPFDPSC